MSNYQIIAGPFYCTGTYGMDIYFIILHHGRHLYKEEKVPCDCSNLYIFCRIYNSCK